MVPFSLLCYLNIWNCWDQKVELLDQTFWPSDKFCGTRIFFQLFPQKLLNFFYQSEMYFFDVVKSLVFVPLRTAGASKISRI